MEALIKMFGFKEAEGSSLNNQQKQRLKEKKILEKEKSGGGKKIFVFHGNQLYSCCFSREEVYSEPYRKLLPLLA